MIMAPSHSKPQMEFQYAIFYVRTGEFKWISKQSFAKMTYPLIVIRDNKIRICGDCLKAKAKKVLTPFLAQAFGFDGFKKTNEKITKMADDLNLWIIAINQFFGKVSGLNKKQLISILSVFIKIISLFKDKKFTPLDIISVGLDLYLLLEDVNYFTAQGGDSILYAALSTIIPDKIFNMIRKGQALSGSKILDDLSMFHDFITSIIGAIESLLEKMKLPDVINKYFLAFLNIFKNSSDHMLILDMEKILDKSKLCKSYLDLDFRQSSTRLNERIEKSHAVKEWSRRSPALLDILQRWTRHMKVLKHYDSPSRVEPVCFIFEGPPGTRKSVIMNGVIEAMGEPYYAHNIKAVMDGKDFYDNYNQEDIFYMDDVGQNGVSQWRPMMNMISSVKLPLDCAELANKDAKFFNSSKVLITTNRFQHLNNGLTKNDCIDDIEALWRRGLVFDFSRVTQLEDFVTGTLVFKYYNLQEKKFVEGFPSYFVKYCEGKEGYNFSHLHEIKTKVDLFIWISSLITVFSNIKKSQSSVNKLTVDERSIISEALKNFNPQVHPLLQGAKDGKVIFRNGAVDMDEFFDAQAFDAQGPSSFKFFSAAKYMFEIVESFFVDLTRDILSFITSLSKPKDHMVSILVTSGLSFLLLFSLYSYFCTDWTHVETSVEEKEEQFFDGQAFKFHPGNAHNSVESLSKSVKDLLIIENEHKVSAKCLVSGRSIILPSHLVAGDRVEIVLFDDIKKNKRLIDNDIVDVVYRNNKEDIVILKMRDSFPSPFRNISQWIKNTNLDDSAYVITSDAWYPIGKTKLGYKSTYGFNKSDGSIFKGVIGEDAISYPYQYKGMCGSIVFSPQDGIIGMHVAGNPNENLGVSMNWSDDIKNVIRSILESDKNLLPLDLKSHKDENSSVIKLDRKMHVSAITKSNFGASPLYGIYPITRKPAELDVYGKFTAKHIGKSSFAIPGRASSAELRFAKQATESMISNFSDLSWKEVVCGSDLLSGLNKKSSNGFMCYPDKDKYIDFETMELTEFCYNEIASLESNIENGSMDIVDWEKMFWVETPKDELRNLSKEGVPRTFRVGTIIQQIMAKRYFGKFVENIIKDRDFNMVMVGCNPIKEWPKMYERLTRGKVFAGDVAKWDKNMVPGFQRELFDIIMSKYKGSKPKCASIVLETLIHSLVVMLDDLYLTTHSLASGHFLTAIFNSLINRMYTAGWYYREMTKAKRKPDLGHFFSSVVDFVYGDDKLNAIYDSHDILNAVTMKDYFESLGMGFTDSFKNPIVTPFQQISEVSFLKRSFVYHNLLGKIVCPLELDVLQSSLSWVDYTKDIPLVMSAKVDNYQREIYLHSDRINLLYDFIGRLKNFNFSFIKLTEPYLQQLYGEDSDYEPVFGSNFCV
jgi:hypothetical protein